MDCSSIREIILTDYSDNQNNEDKHVLEHLESCAECSSYEQLLRQNVLLPFKNRVRQKAPESIWLGVRAQIVSGEVKTSFINEILAFISKPVYVIAFLIFVGAVFFYTKQTHRVDWEVYQFIEEEMDVWSSLSNHTEVNDLLADEVV